MIGRFGFGRYDMATDPGQTLNVAAAHPAVAARLLAIMAAQYNHSWDPAIPIRPAQKSVPIATFPISHI